MPRSTRHHRRCVLQSTIFLVSWDEIVAKIQGLVSVGKASWSFSFQNVIKGFVGSFPFLGTGIYVVRT